MDRYPMGLLGKERPDYPPGLLSPAVRKAARHGKAGLLPALYAYAGKGIEERAAGDLGLDTSLDRASILPYGVNASGAAEWALPQAVVDTYQSMVLPDHAVRGGAWSPEDVTEMAVDVGMLSSVVPGPAGAKRMFGGINAKNAPLGDLAKAEAMEAAGENADDIWRATGWGRGADKKWRFEIDDSGASFEGASTLREMDELSRTFDNRPYDPVTDVVPMGGVLEHEKLYAAYPDVSNVDVRFMPRDKMNGAFGAVSKNGKWVGFADDLSDDAAGTSSALHENQHLVQRVEGFSRGGSPNEFSKLAADAQDASFALSDLHKKSGFSKALNEAVSRGEAPKDLRSMEEFRDAFYANAPESVWEQYTDLMQPIFRAKDAGLRVGLPGDDAYRRLAGEVEARNVQKRMNMTPEERRATPPWATEDVPRDQQIVRNSAGLLAANRGGQIMGLLGLSRDREKVPLSDLQAFWRSGGA